MGIAITVQEQLLLWKEEKMKKILLPLVAVLFSTMVASHLFAMDRDWGRGHGMRDMARYHDKAGLNAVFAKLKLTAEQKEKIEGLRLAYLKEIKPLQDQMFSKRGDLRLLWLQPTPDKEKILTVQKEIRAIRDQLADRTTAFRVDVFNVLTPEQKEKAKAFLHHAGPGRGRGMMGSHPGMEPGHMMEPAR